MVTSALWGRQWSDEIAHEILKWRYSDLPGGEMLLAYDRNRLAAMLAWSTRIYLMHGERVQVREPSDWFCHPDYRPLNLGLRLMCTLMDKQEPLLSIGGTVDANTLLTAFGWSRLCDTIDYTLPLTTRFILSKASRLLRLPVAQADPENDKTSWPIGEQAKAPVAEPASRDDVSIASTDTPAAMLYDLMPLPHRPELEWLYVAPKHLGAFFSLELSEAKFGKAVSIGRLYSSHDLKYAKLIHVHTTSPSVKLYARMLETTIRYARGQKVDAIQARASCRLLGKALRISGFLPIGRTAAHFWPGNRTPLRGPLHLTFLRGDDGIRPYPE